MKERKAAMQKEKDKYFQDITQLKRKVIFNLIYHALNYNHFSYVLKS